LVNIRAVDTFPFEVTSDLGMQKHFNKLSISHNKLGYQIDIPVSVVSEFFGRFNARLEFLPKVGNIERCAITAVVAVAVQMKNLLALD
jgi:hypothetical protein